MTDRSLKWALLISLMVNAAIGGFVAAQFMRPRPRFMGLHHMGPPMPAISDKVRTVLDAAFAAERPSFEKAIGDMVQSRDRSVNLIRANSLDLAALDKELTQMRTANSEAQESFQRVIRTAAQQLDPAGREVLAEILRDSPPGTSGPHGPLGPPPKTPWMRDAPQAPVFLPGEHPDTPPGMPAPN